MSNLFCKIYLDTPLSRDDVMELLQSSVGGGVAQFSRLTTDTLDLDLRKNDEANDLLSKTSDGFMHFRYYLDVEPNDQLQSPTLYVRDIATLLRGMWAANVKAVAACDFENELPRLGGFTMVNEDKSS
jgi:hypothetical protein